ncbi:hypothetical protein BGZ93_004487, partial [Podila epicladia]
MHDIDHIKQDTSTVADYTLRFRRIARLIHDMPERMQVFKYLNGLHPNIKTEVKLRQPDSMTQAIHQASLVWAIVFENGPPTVAKSMAMDIDSLSTSINAFHRSTINNFRSGSKTFTPH